MNDLKRDYQVDKLSISDLFNKINGLDNYVDDNEKIFGRMKEKIRHFFCIKLNSDRKIRLRELEIIRYRQYLESTRKLFDEQIKTVEYLSEALRENNNEEVSEKYFELKEDVKKCLVEAYKIDLQDAYDVLNKNEQEAYCYVQIHDFIENYTRKCNNTKEMQEVKNVKGKSVTKRDANMIFPKWKLYFYLFISLDKRRKFENEMIAHYMKGHTKEENQNIFMNISEYRFEEFQGQISKSIHCQRKKLKLTQQQLQERSGVNRTMIAKIERVQQPASLETIMKLLASLNLNIVLYPND